MLQASTYKAPMEKNYQLRNKDILTIGVPERSTAFLPALLGLPVERYSRPLKEPVFLVTAIGVFIAVHLFGMFYGLESFVKDFGFIANNWQRNFAMNAFFAFFMHGGWMHLVGNSYYLYHFGDDGEHEIGLSATTFLVFGAHACGMLAEAFLGSHQHLPVVGASAGLSGILGFYMIRFPGRQISYMLFMFVVWIHVPVLFAFLWKYFWEMIFMGSGFSKGIAHLAHFGGALFGVLFGLLTKKKRDSRRKESR